MARATTTRPKPASRSLAGIFDDNPLSAVLTVLREAGPDQELRAEEVKAALTVRGVPTDRLDAWRRVQPQLITHEQVSVGGDRYRRTYRYRPQNPAPTPLEALALLAGHRLPTARRAELVQIVRAALDLGGPPQPADSDADQREKEAVRALANMAIDVEEFVANEASARAIVHTVRSNAKAVGLRAIEKAGELTRFDRAQHSSVGGSIADGAPVLVIRPGYVWCRPDGEFLIARAVVQDRSTDRQHGQEH